MLHSYSHARPSPSTSHFSRCVSSLPNHRSTVLDSCIFGKQGVAELMGDPKFKLVQGDMRDL